MTAEPIEHCYWGVPGKFLAGEYPRNLDPHSSARKIKALLASEITAFIELTREDDRLLPYSSMLKGAVYHNFPIADVSIPDSPEVTVAILDAIDEHLREDRVIYLHCWGGTGRTGTIVGCWLVRHGLAVCRVSPATIVENPIIVWSLKPTQVCDEFVCRAAHGE
jgi:hypothetical protein